MLYCVYETLMDVIMSVYSTMKISRHVIIFYRYLVTISDMNL